MQGNVILGMTTTTLIELGGTIPGAEYDLLTIDGELQIAGALTVEAIDAGNGLFEPSVGDEFIVATYASHTGEFADVQLPGLSQPGAQWALDYGDSQLTLRVGGLPGDVDIDGDVDRHDAALLVSHLGDHRRLNLGNGRSGFRRRNDARRLGDPPS